VRAICYTCPGFDMVDIPEVQIKKPDDVKIRIAYAGICGSDIHIIKGDLLIIISSSGETSSLKYVYDLATSKGIESVLITSNENSYIAKKVNPNYVIVGENVNDDKLILFLIKKYYNLFLI
jgi:hypothetical protein